MPLFYKTRRTGDAESHPKAAPFVPSALPISDKPVTLSFSKGPVKSSVAGPNKLPVLGFSLDDAGNDDGNDDTNSEPNKRMQKLFYFFIVCFDHIASALVVKKVAPLIASKKVNESTFPSLGFAHHNDIFEQTANNINKWNQVQEELAQDVTPIAVVIITHEFRSRVLMQYLAERPTESNSWYLCCSAYG